ncbi:MULTISPECIES: hypothetical protein [Anaeromyxobacter]|uniref:hypothetical protein n=1 Tax=Anaeromyxobacter TaxID=161492 RepID=UPI001F59C0D4|nr:MULTISPECIES: hypothetical protein [unclassified Anaeromyxobacter]
MRLRSLAAVSLIALACARAPTPRAAAAAPGAGPADYFPLAVGNEWIYRDESPVLPPAQRGNERTVRIVERTADGYFKDTERGELRADAGCLHDRTRRLLCGPIAAGTRWTSIVSASSTERYEIAGVGEAVTTPAGAFQGCVRVRAHNRAGPDADHVLEITYAPGVGPVKLETFSVVGSAVTPQVRAVLRAYRIGGK